MKEGQNEKNKYTADPDWGFNGDCRNLQPVFTGCDIDDDPVCDRAGTDCDLNRKDSALD